jgi:hypothetical protein
VNTVTLWVGAGEVGSLDFSMAEGYLSEVETGYPVLLKRVTGHLDRLSAEGSVTHVVQIAW